MPQDYAIAWSLALVFDVVVFCLTLIRTFRQALACRDGLFYLMLRDGEPCVRERRLGHANDVAYLGAIFFGWVTDILGPRLRKHAK